jgi:hypothetical protein
MKMNTKKEKEHKNDNEHGTDRDMDADTNLDTNMDMNIRIQRDIVKPTLKSGFGTNFVIVPPYNRPTAPAQYSRRTIWYSPHSRQLLYAKHQY